MSRTINNFVAKNMNKFCRGSAETNKFREGKKNGTFVTVESEHDEPLPSVAEQIEDAKVGGEDSDWEDFKNDKKEIPNHFFEESDFFYDAEMEQYNQGVYEDPYPYLEDHDFCLDSGDSHHNMY